MQPSPLQPSSLQPSQQANSNTDIIGFTPYSTDLMPLVVKTQADSLSIEWSNGDISQFHYIWLRDNCHCQQCVSALTREQLFEICDVPLTIKPVKAALNAENRLVIEWDFAKHISEFLPGWLQSHCYSDIARERRQCKPQVWDKATIQENLPRFAYHGVMQSDETLLNWLKDLHSYGISLIENVDTIPDTVAKVAQRISFIRHTNFGTLFDVRAKPEANSAAYTTLRLPLHTDLPTRELQPGLQFLHCLVNDATGGESILVDGFKIAQYMRDQHSEEYHALTHYPLSFYNKDANSDYRFDAPVIATDSNGEITEIRIANFLRGPLAIAPEHVLKLYAGYQLFIKLTRDKRFQFFHRLQAGELIVFDNRRVLHSRNAFNLTQGGRHLQGCYVDTDELTSKIRVLERSK